MNDAESRKKPLQDVISQLETQQIRMRKVDPYEAKEAHDEAHRQVIEAMKEISQELAILNRDLKWALAISRASRAVHDRLARLLSRRKSIRAGTVLAVVATMVGIVHQVVGWPRLIAWLRRIIAGH
jgi:ferric-dicitrate binding protein FerR (iron transport regulator)